MFLKTGQVELPLQCTVLPQASIANFLFLDFMTIFDYDNQKTRNWLFFIFFITTVCYFVSNINDDCFQLSFEVYKVFVAQKLKILENARHFFHVWTLATSATSRGRKFNLSNLSRVSNFRKICQLSYETLFVALKLKLERVRLRFPKWADSAPPPPGYSEDQKARVF